MKTTLFAAVIIIWSAALPAAAMGTGAPGHAGQPGPVAVPEECYCTECGMLVRADSLFASEIIRTDDKAVFFCDLGDMMLYYEKKGAKKVAAVYVKDYTSGKWTDGKTAFYLTGAKVRTPMRYGIIAFADKKSAEKFRASSGGDEILTFEEAMSKGVYK